MGQLKREQLTDWVEDESGGQVVDGASRKLSTAEDPISVPVEVKMKQEC